MEGYLLIRLSLPAALTYINKKFNRPPTHSGRRRQTAALPWYAKKLSSFLLTLFICNKLGSQWHIWGDLNPGMDYSRRRWWSNMYHWWGEASKGLGGRASFLVIYSPVSICQKILAEDEENHLQQNNNKALRHCGKYQKTAHSDSLSAPHYWKGCQFYFIPY